MKYTEFFEFSNNVSIVASDNGLNIAAKRLHDIGASRVFIVADKDLAKTNIIKKVKSSLESLVDEESEDKDKILTVGKIFSDITGIPSVSTLNKAYIQFKSSGCDSIVGVGGEKASFIAKALNLLISTGSRDVWDFRGVDVAIRKYFNPFCLIPIEFGAGNEVSRIVVIKDEEKNQLIEIVSDVLQPQLCVLYPEFLKELSEEKLYLNLVDSFAFNIDSYLSLKATEITKSLNKSSIFLLKGNFKQALTDKNIESLFNLQRAACISAIAYSNTFGGLINTIANAISSMYEIEHGVAVCCVMRACLEFNKEACAKEYSEILLFALGAKDFVANNELDRSIALVNILSNIINLISKDFNIGTSLSDYGIKEEDLESIALKTISEGTLLSVPNRPTKEDIIDILKKSLKKDKLEDIKDE